MTDEQKVHSSVIHVRARRLLSRQRGCWHFAKVQSQPSVWALPWVSCTELVRPTNLGWSGWERASPGW